MVDMLSQLTDRLYNALLPTTDPYAPHTDVTMEGYYTHLHVPSNNPIDASPLTLVLIICEVKAATDTDKRIMVYVLYVPHHNLSHDTSTTGDNGARGVEEGFVREMCAPRWKLTHSRSDGSNSLSTSGTVEPWSVEVPGIGYMKTDSTGNQHFLVRMPVNSSASSHADGSEEEDEFILEIHTTERTPWSSTSAISGPEGPFERLGTLLPLHWHVFSGCSKAEWQLGRRRKVDLDLDPLMDVKAGLSSGEILASGTAMAHIEKNHGVGFPKGWLWAHCLGPSSPSSSNSSMTSSPHAYQRPPLRFALAGGSILGLEAYLVGFRDDSIGIEWDFAPPLTVGLNGWGAGVGMKVERQWEVEGEEGMRRVKVQCWTVSRWLDVEIVARKDSFISLPGPVPSGFKPAMCHESFTAKFNITLYERPPSFSAMLRTGQEDEWKKVGSYVIEEGALEFGGEYAGGSDHGDPGQPSREDRQESRTTGSTKEHVD